jgi:sec-independent protein translocase protein TatC
MSQEDTFLSHLVELRDRLLRGIISVLVIFAPLAYFRNDLYTWLAQPMLTKLPMGSHMIATEVTTPFFVPMKVAAMVAFVIALPYILYQAWAFIAPGLYANEKKLVMPLVVASYFLFLGGMAFAYFVVFPLAFHFIVHDAPKGVEVMTDIDKYLSFVLHMFLAFGVTFEVPIVVVLLVRTGIVTVEKLQHIRPYVVVGCFVTGAILTPPDMISQFMLAIPLWLLYEVGVFVARFVRPQATEEDDDEVDDYATLADKTEGSGD